MSNRAVRSWMFRPALALSELNGEGFVSGFPNDLYMSGSHPDIVLSKNQIVLVSPIFSLENFSGLIPWENGVSSS